MTWKDLPPFQIWLITFWVAVTGGGLGYSPSRAPVGINAHTLIFVVFLLLLCLTVQLTYDAGRERGEG